LESVGVPRDRSGAGAIGPEYPARIGIDGDETLARAAVGDAHHFGSDAADSRLIFADDVAEQDHLRQRTATRLGRVANRTQVTLVQMLQARKLHAARARRFVEVRLDLDDRGDRMTG